MSWEFRTDRGILVPAITTEQMRDTPGMPPGRRSAAHDLVGD